VGGPRTKCESDHRQTTASLSTLAAVSEHRDSQRGRPRQPDVVRECLGWGAFATLVVPAVLILTGADITTAALGAGAVAAVTASIFVVVRMTGLSLPRLRTSETADPPAPPQQEPPGPAWAPDPVGAEQFYSAPEQPWPPVPVGQTWHEPWDTDWNDEHAWIPHPPQQPWEGTEYDTAAYVPHVGDMPPQPPWLPPAEPTGLAPGPYPNQLGPYPNQLGPYSNQDDRRLPWEHDRGFAEVYHPPEARLPEPRVDERELHPADQRGRHRRGP
jgi:hypothetical protein